MTTTSKEIIDAILNKDNINANEKIYDALYGKSSEELQTRKMQIAKHFFDPDQSTDQEPEENIHDENPEEQGETSEQ